MDEILAALRLKVWRELDTNDAKRFKYGRVRIDNVPRGVYNALVTRLRKTAKENGEGGAPNFRRRKYTSKIKNGERSKSCLTLTTIAPARELLNLSQVGKGGNVLHPTASFATGIVKVSNLSYGIVKFVSLPIALERVIETVHEVTTIAIELGFAIGVVPDCPGTIVRHASGDPGFEANKPLPSVNTWPVLPPYESFENFMKFYVGREIVITNGQLGRLSKQQAEAAGSGEVRTLSTNLTAAATTWSQRSAGESNKRILASPRFTNLQMWRRGSRPRAGCSGSRAGRSGGPTGCQGGRASSEDLGSLQQN